MKVKVVKNLKHEKDLPRYETQTAAGLDLRANCETDLIIQPGCRVLIPTGLKVEIPEGYELQIRPRSGLALKNGITVLNAPGTIDSDYRGEIGVVLINHGQETFIVSCGDRIAQAVLSKFEKVEWEEVQDLSETDRGEGGFGSTGN
jgi:dUTP pyrophosphatase